MISCACICFHPLTGAAHPVVMVLEDQAEQLEKGSIRVKDPLCLGYLPEPAVKRLDYIGSVDHLADFPGICKVLTQPMLALDHQGYLLPHFVSNTLNASSACGAVAAP